MTTARLPNRHDKTVAAVATRVHRLFRRGCLDDPTVFMSDTRVTLPNRKIAEVVKVLRYLFQGDMRHATLLLWRPPTLVLRFGPTLTGIFYLERRSTLSRRAFTAGLAFFCSAAFFTSAIFLA